MKALVLLLVLTVPASAQTIIDGSKADPSILQRVVRDFRDPVSAQFRNLRPGKREAICGEVNAKNAMGGYVGFTKFAVDGDHVNIIPSKRDPVYELKCVSLRIVGCGEC